MVLATVLAAGLGLGIGTLNCVLVGLFPVWGQVWGHSDPTAVPGGRGDLSSTKTCPTRCKHLVVHALDSHHRPVPDRRVPKLPRPITSRSRGPALEPDPPRARACSVAPLLPGHPGTARRGDRARPRELRPRGTIARPASRAPACAARPCARRKSPAPLRRQDRAPDRRRRRCRSPDRPVRHRAGMQAGRRRRRGQHSGPRSSSTHMAAALGIARRSRSASAAIRRPCVLDLGDATRGQPQRHGRCGRARQIIIDNILLGPAAETHARQRRYGPHWQSGCRYCAAAAPVASTSSRAGRNPAPRGGRHAHHVACVDQHPVADITCPRHLAGPGRNPASADPPLFRHRRNLSRRPSGATTM